jgi:lipid II:glycine glycyltransferase (peptidoglycan interpeptide bridge formation enzyme)
LRRTLKRAEPLTEVKIESWNSEALERFVTLVQKKGAEKKFAAPPIEWFKSLIARDENFFSVVSESQHSRTELMISVHGKKAHYLFGATEKYSENSKDSTSTVAHFKVIEKLREMGVTHYDLNGYVVDADPTHPYFGVAEYKKQFGGYPIEYSQIVFEIK